MSTTDEPTDRCGECGHSRSCHPGEGSCLNRDGCRCLGYREHTPADFPEDPRLKIAALLGVLDFQLDSVRYELNHSDKIWGDALHYVDAAEETLTELRRIALARE